MQTLVEEASSLLVDSLSLRRGGWKASSPKGKSGFLGEVGLSGVIMTIA